MVNRQIVRVLVLVIGVIGLGCSDDGGGGNADCSLERVIGDLETTPITDCGTIGLSAADTEFEAARSCVANAIDGENDFRVVWDRQGIDSQVRQGYLGIWDGGTLTVTLFSSDGDPSGGGGAQGTAVGDTCTAFSETDPCTSLREDLCYQCSPGTRTTDCP